MNFHNAAYTSLPRVGSRKVTKKQFVASADLSAPLT